MVENKRNIIKVLKDICRKEHNPHYRIHAYQLLNFDYYHIGPLVDNVVVIFGFSPLVDENDPSIIVDENKSLVSWKAMMKGEWYGNFVTIDRKMEEDILDETTEVLADNALVSIKAILKIK